MQILGDSSALLYHPAKNQRYWFERKDENNSKRSTYYDRYEWWWWLRSPGHANNRAAYVWGNGNIGIQGNGTFRYGSKTIHSLTGDNSGGIRPALWLKLQPENYCVRLIGIGCISRLKIQYLEVLWKKYEQE